MTDYEKGTDPREDWRAGPGERRPDFCAECAIARSKAVAERDKALERIAELEAERATPPVSMGQRRLEALLRAARVHETHAIAMAAPEVQAAIREMAPLVERDPVREMAYELYVRWVSSPDSDTTDIAKTRAGFACEAVDTIATIDAELARLRTPSAPRIK